MKYAEDFIMKNEVVPEQQFGLDKWLRYPDG